MQIPEVPKKGSISEKSDQDFIKERQKLLETITNPDSPDTAKISAWRELSESQKDSQRQQEKSEEIDQTKIIDEKRIAWWKEEAQKKNQKQQNQQG